MERTSVSGKVRDGGANLLGISNDQSRQIFSYNSEFEVPPFCLRPVNLNSIFDSVRQIERFTERRLVAAFQSSEILLTARM